MRHHAALSELRARRREPIAARTLHLCMHSGAVSLGPQTALFEGANEGGALEVGRDSLIMHACAPATAVGPASAALLPPSRLRSLAPAMMSFLCRSLKPLGCIKQTFAGGRWDLDFVTGFPAWLRADNFADSEGFLVITRDAARSWGKMRWRHCILAPDRFFSKRRRLLIPATPVTHFQGCYAAQPYLIDVALSVLE